MIAVIFEVQPTDEGRPEYLERAAELGPQLSEVDGFISIERFVSLTDERRVLSLSFWRDEQAIAEWRQREDHRDAQGAGRDHIFHDYRLRIAEIVRDYGLHDRKQAPADSRQLHG
jgi:heme-degrading monooxygenase HmoA